MWQPHAGTADVIVVPEEVIIRHCEKDKLNAKKYDTGRCSPVGKARAEYIAELWDDGRFARPALLVARAPTGTGARGRGVRREVDTLAPLARATGAPVVDTLHTTSDAANRVARVVSRGAYCGASLLVCWKHEWIIALLNELGCAGAEGCPSYWDENEFDTVVSVRYVLRREGGGEATPLMTYDLLALEQVAPAESVFDLPAPWEHKTCERQVGGFPYLHVFHHFVRF